MSDHLKQPPELASSPGPLPSAGSPYRILGRRYRRTLLFAGWLFARVLGWELVARRIAGEERIRAGRPRRLRRWAREFRELATDMGGVMIKLGQFISSRLDILPPEVIQELASLQDEVPTEPFSVIRQTLHEEFGQPDERFLAFEEVPVAAASLGQAHRARLPDGQRVVVKVQRPGIHGLVHTDLQALRVVAGWAMKLPFIARRADVPALLDEFSAVLWEELDYELEAAHAEAFGAMFADNPGVYIPRVHREHSTRRVLTLEDVTAIKITDYARLERAGINRGDVARRLIDTYLWMVFTQRFYHADPHAGNLFVYPLPEGVSDGAAKRQGRAFYLIFVDFGMAGRLTPEIVAGLRETLVALTTRNAARLVESYQRLGVLLPHADLARVEAATRAVFDRVWGMSMAEISSLQFHDMAALGREFSDLLFSLPFQVPQDFLYLVRCMGILSGLATGLDPTFDPWREIAPFARSLLAAEDMAAGLPPSPGDLLRWQTLRALLSEETLAVLARSGWEAAQQALALPGRAEGVLGRLERGDLRVQTEVPQVVKSLAALEGAVRQTAWAVVFAGLAVGSAIVYSAGEIALSAAGLVLSGLVLLRVVWGGR